MPTCPQCGAPMPGPAPPGACPACVLSMAAATFAGEPGVGDKPRDEGGILDPPVEPGTIGVLDSYDVLEELGAGAMGVVYKATDPALKRDVAIKVLAPALATSREARERFRREARAAAALRDEHLVVIHSVGEWKQVPYLVMEFIEGETLEARLKREGALPIETTVRLGGQIAAGLAAMHDAGLVHRDVKPGNVMIEAGDGPGERAMLSDFGLARTAQDADLTMTGGLCGTPGFMAPEHAEGTGDLDPRSDLFSLGCVLYAMATGRPPFHGRSSVATLHKVVSEQPADPRTHSHDLPPWLADLIMALLEKDPARRPSSAGEVAALLSERRAPRVVGRARDRRWLAVAVVAVAVAVILLLRPAHQPPGGISVPGPALERTVGSLGWTDLAPSEIVLAAENAGQDFFVAVVNTEDEWRRFRLLLSEADRSPVQIYAAVRGALPASGEDVRWFRELDENGEAGASTAVSSPGPPPAMGSGRGPQRWAADRACMRAWLGAWTRAARCLSKISLDHPCLAGMVILDFGLVVENAGHPHGAVGQRLSIDEARQIRTAARSHNDAFAFVPEVPHAALGANIVPGFVLGVPYGAHFFPDEETEVRLSFEVPAQESDEPLLLRFCESDLIRSEHFAVVEKRVLVNGTVVWSESVSGHEFAVDWRGPRAAGPGSRRAEMIALPVPGAALASGLRNVTIPARLVRAGEANTIAFALVNTDHSPTNGCGELLFRCWDVRLTRGGETIPCTVSFHTRPHEEPYPLTANCSGAYHTGDTIANWESRAVHEGDAAALPDSAEHGHARQHLIAAPNTPYSLVDIADGIISKELRAER